MFKPRIQRFFAVSLALILFSSFINEGEKSNEKIRWYTWEEAMNANEKEPRKIMVDVYADWCYWCKVMDKKTFSKKKVAKYINTHFYPVKLNAEQKEDIVFRDRSYKYMARGRSGCHELAAALLDGQVSFPSMVYLDEKLNRILVSQGYKKGRELLKELEYAKNEDYKKGAPKD